MSGQAWQRLEGLDPDGASFPARVRLGTDGIVVFRVKDGWRGVERTCPHLQASLFDGVLMADETMLRCARHAFTFRLADGKPVNCPGYRLKVFEIRREGDALMARPVE